MTTYQHLTTEERAAISALRQSGMDISAIARQLNRHRSTISRELRRNSCNDSRYRVDKASRKARARRRISRRNLQISRSQWIGIKRLIRANWSPQQISERYKKDGLFNISHEGIYQLIKDDQLNGGNLWTFLRCSRKKRRKRYGSYDSRGRLAGKRMINERPEDIQQRAIFGHWEGDTVMGTDKACFCTLVERKTRYTMIIKLKNHTVEELNRAVIKQLQPIRHHFKSITFDNGSEFHGYKELESKLDTTVYFAQPYSPHQRGTNENTNGLIRQFAPKRTSLSQFTQTKCNQIARRLNTRPRKSINYQTPHEALLHEDCVALQS